MSDSKVTGVSPAIQLKLAKTTPRKEDCITVVDFGSLPDEHKTPYNQKLFYTLGDKNGFLEEKNSEGKNEIEEFYKLTGLDISKYKKENITAVVNKEKEDVWGYRKIESYLMSGKDWVKGIGQTFQDGVPTQVWTQERPFTYDGHENCNKVTDARFWQDKKEDHEYPYMAQTFYVDIELEKKNFNPFGLHEMGLTTAENEIIIKNDKFDLRKCKVSDKDNFKLSYVLNGKPCSVECTEESVVPLRLNEYGDKKHKSMYKITDSEGNVIYMYTDDGTVIDNTFAEAKKVQTRAGYKKISSDKKQVWYFDNWGREITKKEHRKAAIKDFFDIF